MSNGLQHTPVTVGVWKAKNVETALKETDSLWDVYRDSIIVIETASEFHDEAEEDLEYLAQVSPPCGWENVVKTIYCDEGKWLAQTQWKFTSDGTAPYNVV